jgi:hypothetical protein
VTVWTSTSLALLPAPKRAALGAVRGANGGDAVMIAEVWVHGGTVALSKLPLTSRFCQVGVHGASIGVASIGRASIGGGASIGRASTTAPSITAPSIAAASITAPSITAPSITAPSTSAASTTAPSTSAAASISPG